jgi:hypothetical protein
VSFSRSLLHAVRYNLRTTTETCTGAVCAESCGGGVGNSVPIARPGSPTPPQAVPIRNLSLKLPVGSELRSGILKRMNSYVGIPADNLACYCYEMFVLKFVTAVVLRIEF